VGHGAHPLEHKGDEGDEHHYEHKVSKMYYGLSHYVMALQEIEKARLEYRTRKAHQESEPLPDRRIPRSGPDCHGERAPRRRLRHVY
jgi:hypothetical protein